ncbi:tRNA 5-methoxyuridine(34)/uridine 5-oxyacetic acid(34) synthase CmoB [Marinospirillum insulare]|uniref:tRNA U34 carboxymethyltransferase n=1 Tax=Marinospirillum insulare TaxID=217169 RepID=A0ABQ5ZWS2_9GAMM|nr:tRNA 5-methoxyuridine(34)/uridine 5-oxyacetic acid(34) synthase CmoB [Marinospirillum insulare]GLR64599.1 tRNA U34 carboxymethyltransferase [Marinospirillum insulare]
MQGPDFSEVFQQLALLGRERPGLHTWLAKLPEQLTTALDTQRFPEFVGWWKRIEKLPEVVSAEITLNTSVITTKNARLENKLSLTDNQQKMLTGLLQDLKPWRKGPYQLENTYLDTEWRSDFKWDRLAPHLSNLLGRKVLDVGGGSGYHAWRLAGAGAEFTLCIDPSPRYFAQFEAARKLMGPKERPAVYHLPLGIEAVPKKIEAFDTVLSMGVLYHRRSPIDHLYELKDCLRPGGELVLETLVIEGDETACLMPEDRYAAMSNVWFLPSVAQLKLWLRRCGYKNIRCVDLNLTSTEEQRATEWMTFQSLADFLDPQNPQLTREGYPAPLRAIVIAEK